jgi:hypothetical protein
VGLHLGEMQPFCSPVISIADSDLQGCGYCFNDVTCPQAASVTSTPAGVLLCAQGVNSNCNTTVILSYQVKTWKSRQYALMKKRRCWSPRSLRRNEML